MSLTLKSLLDVLGPGRRPVAELWRGLGVERRELQRFIAAHRDELAAAGVQLHTATASQAAAPRLHVEIDGRRYAALSLPVVEPAQVVEQPAPLARVEPAELATVEARPALDLAVAAWLDSKRGRSGSTRTHAAYADTLADFRRALAAAGLDLDGDGRAVALVAQGWAQGSKRGRSVKPSTVAQRLNILSSFYQFARRRGLLPLDGNPIDTVERPRVEAYAEAAPLDPRGVRVALTTLRRVAAAGDAVSLRDLALLRVMLTTGRRVAEVAALRWRDVVVSDGQRVELSYRAKGGKHMRDALAPSVAADLLRWLHAHYGAALGDLAPDAPIWPALRPGRPAGPALTAQGVAGVVERHLETHPHALRHAFAAAMVEAGAKLPELQARLGHSSLETTGRYVAQLGKAHNPHAEALASLFDAEE
jgi:integrase